MADIRINALATTAASTASDDYIAIDGSANGTRKLNAYSPTFGGNLTVSGGTETISGNSAYLKLTSTGASKTWDLFADSGGSFYIAHSGVLNALQIAPTTGAATLAGNLTVSGGAITLLDPNVNLQADASNLRFDNYAGKGFLWSIGGSARLNLNSSGNLLLGTTTDAGGKLQIVTGANSTLLIGNDATYSSYNQIALNGVRTNNATLGIIGGGTGDNKLYLLAPSGGGLLFQVAAVTKFSVSSAGDATFAGTIATQGGTASTPASASATGTAGTIQWDASYIYVCTATDTWKRAAIATW